MVCTQFYSSFLQRLKKNYVIVCYLKKNRKLINLNMEV